MITRKSRLVWAKNVDKLQKNLFLADNTHARNANTLTHTPSDRLTSQIPRDTKVNQEDMYKFIQSRVKNLKNYDQNVTLFLMTFDDCIFENAFFLQFFYNKRKWFQLFLQTLLSWLRALYKMFRLMTFHLLRLDQITLRWESREKFTSYILTTDILYSSLLHQTNRRHTVNFILQKNYANLVPEISYTVV